MRADWIREKSWGTCATRAGEGCAESSTRPDRHLYISRSYLDLGPASGSPRMDLPASAVAVP